MRRDVTVNGYIKEVTSHFKKRWWAVTVHNYIMEVTSDTLRRDGEL